MNKEWEGEPHTLTVVSVTPPEGPFDYGELEYEVQHLESCKQETFGFGPDTYVAYVCDVGEIISDVGLEFALDYSGTPVTVPGTYSIRAWGRKYYVWDYGAYEYDNGIGLVTGEGTE